MSNPMTQAQKDHLTEQGWRETGNLSEFDGARKRGEKLFVSTDTPITHDSYGNPVE